MAWSWLLRAAGRIERPFTLQETPASDLADQPDIYLGYKMTVRDQGVSYLLCLFYRWTCLVVLSTPKIER